MEHVHDFHAEFSYMIVLTAALAGLLCGALGPYLVWKRLGLLSDSVSHASLAVIAIALAFGLPETSLLIPFAVVLGLLMSYLQKRSFSELDSIIAVFFAGFMGLGIIIMNQTGRGSDEVLHVLFGDIESVSGTDVLWLAVLTFIVLTYLARYRDTLRLTLVQPELAKLEGINVQRHTTILLVMCSVAVAVCLKLMGVVLVTMLFVAPSLIALSFTRSARTHALLSLAIGIAIAVGGVGVAQLMKWPISATVALLGFSVFIVTATLKGRAA